MEWLDSLVGALGGGLLSILGSVVYFKPKLKEAKAEASKAETEAGIMQYEHLMARVNSMEELYKRQGEIVDGLRNDVMKKSQENFDLKSRVEKLERENRELKQMVENLTKKR